MSLRVVYVVHADPGAVAPADALRRWPTATLALQALRSRGVGAVGVARTRSPSQLIDDEGVRWHFVADQSRSARRLAQVVRAERPDVVHINGTGFALATIVLRAFLGRRVRIVVQHHGEPPGGIRSRLARRCASLGVQGYAFTGGLEQAEPFVSARVLSRRAAVFDVLESSADVMSAPRGEARQQTGVHGEPAVICVGRLVPGKDPLTAVRGFLRFAAQAPNAHLWWLFHDDMLRAGLERELSAAGEPGERVHLVGEVGAHEVGAWLSACDVFVSASRHEGSGYSLIEALRCGCTPVVSDIAPHRAIAGEVGARFAVGDAVALGTALALARVDRLTAQRRFADALTWEHVARQLSAAYHSSQ